MYAQYLIGIVMIICGVYIGTHYWEPSIEPGAGEMWGGTLILFGSIVFFSEQIFGLLSYLIEFFIIHIGV